MKLWLDHQLSPHLCGWLEEHFDTSNMALKTLFETTLHEALQLLKSGERLVEISDANRPPKALL